MSPEANSLLLVDDNEMNRDMLSRRLERKGYVVTLAAGGKEALEIIGRQAFDLVLLDVMMPDINGMDVLKMVRETHSATQLPVIMVTAKDRSEDIVEALKLGASDYVTKPIDFQVVHARIETQLALKRAVDQISQLEKDLQRRNEELETANAELVEANKRMRRELASAARVQQSLLPSSAPSLREAGFAWGFRPCDELAGDLLNVIQLDDRRVGLYVLDVVGHGVAAALLSVAVTRVLTPRPDGQSLLSRSDPAAARPQLTPPGKVAEELNRLFPMQAPTEQFFTLLYGILDLDALEFRYVSAGHPGPVRISAGSEPVLDSKPTGLPIGIAELPYAEQVLQLKREDRVYLYSDGLTEAMNEDLQQFEAANLMGTIAESRSMSLKDSVSAVMQAAERWCGKRAPHDDITLVAFEVGGGQ